MRLGLGGGLGPLKWYVPITSGKKRSTKPMSKKDKEETAEALTVLLTSSLFWAFVGIIFFITAIISSYVPTGARIGYAIMGAGMVLTFVLQFISSKKNSKLFEQYKEKVKAWEYLTEEDKEIVGEPPEFEPWNDHKEAVIGLSVLISIVGFIVVLVAF